MLIIYYLFIMLGLFKYTLEMVKVFGIMKLGTTLWEIDIGIYCSGDMV